MEEDIKLIISRDSENSPAALKNFLKKVLPSVIRDYPESNDTAFV